MATKEQIAANRRNAQKSTGPRTAEGKAKAARNAIKHGLLSREVVLQIEDRAEFETFRDGMIADLHPAGALECLLADQVAASAWRLARVLRCLRERLERDFAAAVDNWHETTAKRKAHNPECKDLRPVTLGVALTTGFTADLPYGSLHRYEAQIERSMYKALRELERVQAARAPGRQAEREAGNAEPVAAEPERPGGPETAKRSQSEDRVRSEGGARPTLRRTTSEDRPQGRERDEITKRSQSGPAGNGAQQGCSAAPEGSGLSG